MGRKYDEDESEQETEETGSDLEQLIAMLEKAEVDYEKTDSDDEILVFVGDNNQASFYFDEDGNLSRVM